MRRVIFHRADSLDEALALKTRFGNDARILAGGTDLLIALRNDSIVREPLHLIDIWPLREMARVDRERSEVTIDTLVTHAQVESDEEIRRVAPLLSMACGQIGSPQIRNRGTVGGNLCNASACADTVPPLLALEASVTLRSERGERAVPLADMILSPYRTVIEPDELLTHIRFDVPGDGAVSSFIKLGRRNALAVSRMSVAVVARRDGDQALSDVRVAAGSVAPKPQRFAAVEELLSGQQAAPELFAAAGRRLAKEMIQITGRRWSTPYKEPVVSALLERALAMALGDASA
jgi:carbon-monoxide dehydrogenase medium subunit/xanthine dehydrogenase FAD-binding subunit